MKKQRSSRGASPKRVKPSREPVCWSRLYPLVVLLMVGFIGSGLYQLLEAMQSQPIDRVVITGEFQYVDRELFRQQLQPYLYDGFVTVNLSEIRQELEAQPWIYQVSIERQWPNQLLINVIEQDAIAHWGEKAFLNHRGELFEPETKVVIKHLPQLGGSDLMAKKVMENYRELSGILRQQNIVLRSLTIDERANWFAVIGENTKLVLGKREILKKLNRFIHVYKITLSEKFEQIATVDMRYGNGLAVAWRKQGQRG